MMTMMLAYKKVLWISSHVQYVIISIALRIEWCKARARAAHWSEEVTELMEEMCHVKEFLDWHAGWWDEQAFCWSGLEQAQMEGVVAYARRQAAMRCKMRQRFETQWRFAAEWVSLGQIPDNDESSAELTYDFYGQDDDRRPHIA
jgi:hypothetical protein